MSLWDRFTLLFRPRERAFRRDIDEIYEGKATLEKCGKPQPGDVFFDDKGNDFVVDYKGRLKPLKDFADNPPQTGEKKSK